MGNVFVPTVQKPATQRKWVKCPNCGAKVTIYDDSAECRGVHLKCTRGCKCEFELVIHRGKQQLRNTSD